MTQRPLAVSHAARTRAPRPLDRVNAFLASSGGLGLAPVASGTFGTLGGVALALLFKLWVCPRFEVDFGLACGAAVVLLLATGVALGRWAEGYWGMKDPKPFVLDEVMGYLVALVRFPPRGEAWHEGPGWKDGPSASELLLAFVAFRLFDVLKPWPGRRLEFLKGGWGIMLDDLVAGLYTWMLVFVIRDFARWP